MTNRRKARELVLEALYRIEIAQQEPEQIFNSIITREKLPETVKEFTKRLLTQTVARLSDIDSIIKEVAENWRLERIAVIDRNILRFAICEILYFDDVPDKVSIDEAIEIAKKFSTDDSGRFVNGILDKVLKSKFKNQNVKL